MHRLLMVPTVIQILQIQKIALLGISSSRFSIYKTFSMLNNRKLAKTEQYRRILKKLTHMIRSSLLETKSSKKKPINNCVNQLCSNRLSLKGYKASNLNTRPPANKINSSGCNIRRHSNSNSSSSRCSLSSLLCKHLHSWINHLRISNNKLVATKKAGTKKVRTVWQVGAQVCKSFRRCNRSTLRCLKMMMKRRV